jgi:hypothetical protein
MTACTLCGVSPRRLGRAALTELAEDGFQQRKHVRDLSHTDHEIPQRFEFLPTRGVGE